MEFNLTGISLIANSEAEIKAAELFSDEIKIKSGTKPDICRVKGNVQYIEFICNNGESEDFSVTVSDNHISVSADRLRGLIYGFFLILRKSVIRNNQLILQSNITGAYKPQIEMRGHNLSYTSSNNTCDGWSKEHYRRYILDLMAFGTNLIEDSYGDLRDTNPIMQMSFKEALNTISGICKEFDLDFTFYYPLNKNLTDEETVKSLKEAISGLPVLTNLFLPGGDPGNMQADAFVERCKYIKHELSEIYPELRITPSAQAPHEYPDWGEKFKKSMADCPEEISRVIFGPNHAMPLDELRRSINEKYPIDQYADITHNVRCETPVHFTRDDWHYAWAATLSRESVNPRPREYRLLHIQTRQYLNGNVPYSEGVNDDINKTVWSALDFDFNCSVREILKDYARLFIPEMNPEQLADLIFGLELNWETAPEESFSVGRVFGEFEDILKSKPQLYENWRFLLLYFRALCDKIVRERRIFELELIDKATAEIRFGNMKEAETILSAEFTDEYKARRSELFTVAEKLFDLIRIQLDVEHFCGKNYERGCTLDTIDMPVTDREFLLNKIRENHSREIMLRIIDRNKTEKDEYYFSFAEHGLPVCGKQEGEYYFNFNGDNNKKSERQMCLLNGFDHFNFRFSAAGLTGGNYILRVTYADDGGSGTEMKISVNGHILYEGERFGGIRDEEYEKEFLPKGFISVVYDVPAEYIENGCALLEITEPHIGFIIYEFRFTKCQ